MEKFEYKLLTISTAHLRKFDFQAELELKFQNWGSEGWELVKMEPIQQGSWFGWFPITTKFLVVFKRKK